MTTFTSGRYLKGILLLTFLLVIYLLAVVRFDNDNVINSMTDLKNAPSLEQFDPLLCVPGVPCEYEDEVGIRIIVITQKRTESLMKTLTWLENLDTDGDTAALEIWFDRMKDGSVSSETIKAAHNFKWSKGKKRVHIQQQNVGILGQWIDTWRPKNNTKELCLILEDDIDVSPHFYKFLKAAHKTFGHLDNIQGYSLQDENVVSGSVNLGAKSFPKEQVFLNPIIGTWGYAPHPKNWRLFQDWFHEKRKDKLFKPYVPAAKKVNQWFSSFVGRGTQDNMWEMWTIRYAAEKRLWSVFNNLRSFVGKNKGLSWNRQEVGLHFTRSNSHRGSENKLLQEWDESYTKWPQHIRIINYDASTYKMIALKDLQKSKTVK